MAVDPTTVTLPAELIPSDGRFGSGPSKVRPEAARRARRGRRQRTSAPATAATACARSCGSIRERPRRAVRAPRRLRGAARQRWQHRVLGRRRVRPRRPARRAPRVRRVLLQVRRRHHAPRRSSTTRSCCESQPGTHPELVADATVDTYAYPHNETSTGVMTDVRRPGDDGLVLVDAHVGRRVASAVEPDPLRRVLLRAAEVLRRRRRALARAVLPGRHRAHRAARRGRALGAAVAQPADRARELPPRPDLQHARARLDLPAREQRALDARPGRPRVHRRPLRPVRRARSTAGPRRARSPRRSWPSRRSAAT